MRHKLRLCLLLSLAIIAAVSDDACAAVRRGQKSFGPSVGYVSRNSSAYASLNFEYAFSRHVRIAPQVGVIFRNRDLDGLNMAADVHFPIGFAAGRMAVYPLVGLNFTSWGRHGRSEADDKDVTSHSNRLGLNMGAGLELDCTSSLRLRIEGRYSLMEHYPTAFATVGIAYVF